MKSIEAIVATVLCMAVALSTCIAADFNSVTWSTSDGITVTEYTIIGGKLTTSEKWLKASDGTVLYEGSYRNGGQVQWSILPPKKPTSIFDNTPQVFQSSISWSGFPSHSTPTSTFSGSGGSSLEAYNSFISKPMGSSEGSFTDKFNALASAKYGSSFKPLTFGSGT